MLSGGDGLAYRPAVEDFSAACDLAANEETILTQAKADIKPHEVSFLEMFAKVLSGDYLEDLSKIAEQTSADHVKMLKVFEEDRETKFGKDLAVACNALEPNIVATETASAAPSLSIRRLARVVSDAGDPAADDRNRRQQEERDAIWKKAVDIRVQKAKVALWPSDNKQPEKLVKTLLDNREAANLALNASHRGVFLVQIWLVNLQPRGQAVLYAMMLCRNWRSWPVL